MILSLINHNVLSFDPIDSSAKIYVLPSKSLTPPREDHAPAVELYPSYWFVSVLNLIDPSETIPIAGLAFVSPAGILRAVVALTFTTLFVSGWRTKSFADEVEITFALIVVVSSTFKDPVVFNSPEVRICDDEALNEIPLPTEIDPLKILLDTV